MPHSSLEVRRAQKPQTADRLGLPVLTPRAVDAFELAVHIFWWPLICTLDIDQLAHIHRIMVFVPEKWGAHLDLPLSAVYVLGCMHTPLEASEEL